VTDSRRVTVLVHAEIHGLVGRATDLRTLLAEHAETTSRAPGSAGCVAYEPLGAEPGEYVLDAWWSDEAALRAHYASEEYGLYVVAIGELLARPSDVQVHYIERSVRARGDASLDPTRQG
jgi:quinol monooxygenase YgiN